MMNPFFKEAPTETRMFPCPACQEIISVGNTSCRYCGIPIECKYGRLETRDKEHPEAVRAMRNMLLVWTAALVIQAVVLAYALS